MNNESGSSNGTLKQLTRLVKLIKEFKRDKALLSAR